jgi:hypothetical protein
MLSFYKREADDIPAGLAPLMARALGVSVDELLGETEKKRRAAVGPTGRMRRLFEAAAKLPRSQQQQIAVAQLLQIHLPCAAHQLRARRAPHRSLGNATSRKLAQAPPRFE